MAPYTFKATTDPTMMINADYHVQFKNVVDNTLGAEYDPNTDTLVIPKSGTYALSVKLMLDKGNRPGYDSGNGAGAFCEIVVDGVETPLVLNENKTCARVILQLDSDKRVWVEYFGGFNSLRSLGEFSVCLLHGSSN